MRSAVSSFVLAAFLAAFLAVFAVGCSSGGEGGALRLALPDGGQVFPKLTLQGLRSAATSDAPEAISTWEDEDPDGQRFDLLHVMVICMWCPHCNNETAAVMKATDWQASHRVAVMQIAIEGYTSQSPSWSEMQTWAKQYAVTFPVLLDGQAAQLGQSISVPSVPLNIMVNPRSMAVLAMDVGEVGDIEAYEGGFLP